MDCLDNRRYHPYAPPANARQERYLGKEWQRRDHNPLFRPDGHRGGRNHRYPGGRRGTGHMSRSMDRDDIYHSHPSHRPVRSGEGHLDPRYEGPPRRPSPPWYQGRSMHYGPPRPPTNYYYERNTRVHYRDAGYSPPPRLHPKSMRHGSARPTGLVVSFQKNTVAGLKVAGAVILIVFIIIIFFILAITETSKKEDHFCFVLTYYTQGIFLIQTF